MRLLAHLLTVIVAAALAAVPVAVAANPDDRTGAPGQSDKPAGGGPSEGTGKPGDTGKPAEDRGKPEDTGKPEDKDKAKPDQDRVPPGQAKKDHHGDTPLHPLGGSPGLVREPNESAHPEHTVLAETIGATPNSGTIRVKVPGAEGFADLTAGAPLPMDSVVDATEGLVEIGAEAPGGVEQNAVVTGGVFRVEQDPSGVTDLTLQAGDFSACGKGDRVTARAARSPKNKSKGSVARGLWAAGKGRFRTHGRSATASVRGTRWAIVDRCHSTTVKVFEGLVDVLDRTTGRTIPVAGGERHVARRS